MVKRDIPSGLFLFSVLFICLLFIEIIIMGLVFPFGKPTSEIDGDVLNNIDVEIRSPRVIREGNEFSAIVEVKNLNNQGFVTLNSITISNSKNEVILFEEVNQKIQSIGKSVERMNNILKILSDESKFIIFAPFLKIISIVAEKTNSEIIENRFEKIYRFRLDQFYPVKGEDMVVYLEVELDSYGKKATKKVDTSILISEPLPKP